MNIVFLELFTYIISIKIWWVINYIIFIFIFLFFEGGIQR